MGARQAGVRITLRAPDVPGALAKITAAIAEQGGDIAACGTYPAEEPLKFNVVLKIRHVPQDDLVARLRELEEAEVLDVRAA